MSPKAQRELAECASDIDVELNRIGRILGVRWVASSRRTVKAVWKSYSALLAHFTSKTTDMHLDSKERAKFAGMTRKLENPIFLSNLGLMYGALEELSDLSLALQKADVTLSAANKLIPRQVQIFSARKECDSEFYSEACQAVRTGAFRGIQLAASVGKERAICKSQFYQALADSMSARLMPDSEKSFCRAAEILDSASLLPEQPPEHGESDLRMLCTKFGLPFSDCKTAYREFKASQGKTVHAALREVLNCVNTIYQSTLQLVREGLVS